MTRVLHLDFETYAEVGVNAVGSYVYVRQPSFMVTVMAWAFDGEPVRSLEWPHTLHLPKEIKAHLAVGGTLAAHNAAFEHDVLEGFYGVSVAPEALDCTMQRALVWGLPAGLGPAGNALNLSVVKDEAERPLMLQMSRPRVKGAYPWHEVDAAKMARLVAYCVQDVEAERALGEALPPLSDFERRVADLDARSNRMGVEVDRMAAGVLGITVDVELREIDKECALLTGGAVASPGTAAAKLMAWLVAEGTVLHNLTKEVVADALRWPTLPTRVRRVLELRQMAAKSSLAKLDKMLDVSAIDGRARGLLQYYGAGRTGRWAGRMIQVQNLPRPKPGVNVDAVIRIAAASKPDERLPPLLFDKPLDVISSCLRGCLVAKAGHALLSLDLSQIEARVLAWLAGQADVLEEFRQGRDVYTFAAAKIGSGDRQLGKVVTLACGYGMGPVKFQDTARSQYGVELTLEEAEDAVAAWRLQNKAIKNYWRVMGDAVELAAGNPGTVERAGMAQVKMAGGVLMVKKPNGEKLFYHGMRWAGRELTFDGTDQKTGKWGTQRTYGGKLVENLTQAVARDVLAEAVLRVERLVGLVPVMTVHDEAVWELSDKHLHADHLTIQAIFNEVPAWAPGLPIASEARTGRRYGK